MADLDDFFAKKDRKKSKTKKFTTAEELAKRIEDTSKKAGEVKPKKVTPANADSVETKNIEEVEEEWKEFEEERKDYSGLKLAQLNIGEDDTNQSNLLPEDGGGGTPGDNDGERNESGDRKVSGAWKLMGQTSDSAEKQQQQQQQLQQQQRPTSNVYVSPAVKSLKKVKKGVAPDLKSEEFFPTLGAEQPDPTRSKKDATFEEVKHGGRVRPSDLPSAAPLSVGNRFTSLSNDAS